MINSQQSANTQSQQFDNISFEWISSNHKNYKEQYQTLIKQIFVQEQGFSEDKCFDKSDDYNECPSTLYILLYNKLNQKYIGIARLLLVDNNTIRLGRFGLLKEVRGNHYGNFLMQECLKKCKELNTKKIILGSQHQVIGFYKKYGFEEIGETYYVQNEKIGEVLHSTMQQYI